MTSYQNIGKRDISFFIVNHARGEAFVNELTRRVSFPVYQDENITMIQQKLNASIDDIFLYDRYKVKAIIWVDFVLNAGYDKRHVDLYLILYNRCIFKSKTMK